MKQQRIHLPWAEYRQNSLPTLGSPLSVCHRATIQSYRNGLRSVLSREGVRFGELQIFLKREHFQLRCLSIRQMGEDYCTIMVSDNTFQLPFFFGNLEELHIHRSQCHKAIHHNVPLLAKSMGTIHRLDILLWIPVRVVQNDRIGCTQIDSQPSRASR